MMAYLQENDSVNMPFWIKKKERYTSQHPLLINTKQSTKNYCLNKTI